MLQSTCHHVLASGVLCQATPLRNRDYCRFHLQQIGRRMKAARSRARQQAPVLKLPLLEDLYSVQVALMQLADAIAYREIDPQYARLLTTVLRLAMQNLKSKLPWERSSRFHLAANLEACPTTWDTFEQEHDLPTDFNLSLDPEVAFPPDLPLNPTEGLNGAPRHERTTGAPHVPGVGVYGNDDPLRARVSQIMRDAETPVPGSPVHVTADDVEILDVYEREGEPAMMQCIAEQQRNRTRRERRARRLYYEEVARNRNIQIAATKLAEDQRKTEAATKTPSASASTSEAITPTADSDRKPPQSEAGTRRQKTVAGEA